VPSLSSVSALIGMFAAIVAAAAPGISAEPSPLAFVRKNCASCHNASVSSGGIDFTVNANPDTFVQNREIWERALAKLKAGEMPPPGVPRPPAADVAAVVQWLQSEFTRQDNSVQPDAGRVAARRLNKAEYNNTVRDLLGVDLRPADDFPADQAAYGFDNVSDALNISSVLLEKYADAAERSVRTALFGPEKLRPAATHYPFPVKLNDARGRAPKLPDLTDYDLTGLSLRSASHVTHRFPVEGLYSFRIVLNGHRPNQSMPARVALWIDGKMAREFEVDATDLEGQVRETRTRVAAGEHLLSVSYLKQYHGLPPSYGGPEPSTRPPAPLLSSTRGQLNEHDIEVLRRLGTTIKPDGVETRIDNRFESIDIGGPFEQATGPSLESRGLIYSCGHLDASRHNASCPRVIVTNFAQRAFRRPLAAREADTYLSLYTLARKQGDSFDNAIAAALEGVMVSPSFLFRIERDQPAVAKGNAIPVSDYEMASRLSYFLWSTMPDSELMRLASERRLRQPAVLEAQVKRMLHDEKAHALVENFGGQWLQFRNVDVVRPDLAKFPDFDESLRHSMRRETELFLDNIVRNDGSVLDILDANYTFVDERLARFYGIPGIRGPEFRRVDMSAAERGGGVLAQAGILMISSYSTRTSPVLRGKWILENLLNAPPPPPPPSVPALDDTKVGQSASLRQQMEAHRASPVCASCHSKMDPLGFGLENLNAIGQWRDKDGNFPVDASGLLPGGEAFRGPKELKALMLQRRDAFVAGLTEKMTIYALGRGIERFDRPALQAVETRMAAHDYRFSQLVLGIVRSLPFQMKHAQEPAQVTVASAGERSR
jgi:mono/diheme cytochrome c family protein